MRAKGERQALSAGSLARNVSIDLSGGADLGALSKSYSAIGPIDGFRKRNQRVQAPNSVLEIASSAHMMLLVMVPLIISLFVIQSLADPPELATFSIGACPAEYKCVWDNSHFTLHRYMNMKRYMQMSFRSTSLDSLASTPYAADSIFAGSVFNDNTTYVAPNRVIRTTVYLQSVVNPAVMQEIDDHTLSLDRIVGARAVRDNSLYPLAYPFIDCDSAVGLLVINVSVPETEAVVLDNALVSIHTSSKFTDVAIAFWRIICCVFAILALHVTFGSFRKIHLRSRSQGHDSSKTNEEIESQNVQTDQKCICYALVCLLVCLNPIKAVSSILTLMFNVRLDVRINPVLYFIGDIVGDVSWHGLLCCLCILVHNLRPEVTGRKRRWRRLLDHSDLLDASMGTLGDHTNLLGKDYSETREWWKNAAFTSNGMTEASESRLDGGNSDLRSHRATVSRIESKTGSPESSYSWLEAASVAESTISRRQSRRRSSGAFSRRRTASSPAGVHCCMWMCKNFDGTVGSLAWLVLASCLSFWYRTLRYPEMFHYEYRSRVEQNLVDGLGIAVWVLLVVVNMLWVWGMVRGHRLAGARLLRTAYMASRRKQILHYFILLEVFFGCTCLVLAGAFHCGSQLNNNLDRGFFTGEGDKDEYVRCTYGCLVYKILASMAPWALNVLPVEAMVYCSFSIIMMAFALRRPQLSESDHTKEGYELLEKSLGPGDQRTVGDTHAFLSLERHGSRWEAAADLVPLSAKSPFRISSPGSLKEEIYDGGMDALLENIDRRSFCLETALRLMEICQQTYNRMPPAFAMQYPSIELSGDAQLQHKPYVNIKRYGFDLHEIIHEEETSTRLLVGIADDRIAVTFRGTMDFTNLHSDLKMTQIPLPRMKLKRIYFKKLVHRLFRNRGYGGTERGSDGINVDRSYRFTSVDSAISAQSVLASPSFYLEDSSYSTPMRDTDTSLTPGLRIPEILNELTNGEHENEHENSTSSEHDEMGEGKEPCGSAVGNALSRASEVHDGLQTDTETAVRADESNGFHDNEYDAASAVEMSTLSMNDQNTFDDTAVGRSRDRGGEEDELKLESSECEPKAETGFLNVVFDKLCASLPALQSTLPHIHKGFWDAYKSVRERFLRSILSAIIEHRQRDLQRYDMESGPRYQKPRFNADTSCQKDSNDDVNVEESNDGGHDRATNDGGPLEIHLCGHSLGGALAIIAAFDLSLNIESINEVVNSALSNHYGSPIGVSWELPIIQVYGFGTPRVGNDAFVHLCWKHLENIFRVEVDGDVIPMTPKIFRMYTHAGLQVLLSDDESGNVLVNPTRLESHMLSKQQYCILNHDLACYRANLEACFEADDLREYLEKEHIWTLQCEANAPVAGGGMSHGQANSTQTKASQDLPGWAIPVREKI